MLIDRLFKDYKNGFYVFAPEESRITSCHVTEYPGTLHDMCGILR